MITGVVVILMVLFLRWRKPLRSARPKYGIDSLLFKNKKWRPNQGTDNDKRVIFTWNGHDWDAYEVLRVPTGSSLDDVTKAYDQALTQVDSQSQEFIKKAYRCILQKVS